jgi:nitrogen regulatory protein PII
MSPDAPRGYAMKQFTIVVKPFRAEAVLRAIAERDVTACVVREAKGYSRQKGYLDRYAGSEYSMAFIPKVEITVCVSDERAEEVADHIVRAARTGRIGDGKVFVLSMGWPDAIEF